MSLSITVNVNTEHKSNTFRFYFNDTKKFKYKDCKIEILDNLENKICDEIHSIGNYKNVIWVSSKDLDYISGLLKITKIIITL